MKTNCDMFFGDEVEQLSKISREADNVNDGHTHREDLKHFEKNDLRLGMPLEKV